MYSIPDAIYHVRILMFVWSFGPPILPLALFHDTAPGFWVASDGSRSSLIMTRIDVVTVITVGIAITVVIVIAVLVILTYNSCNL